MLKATCTWGNGPDVILQNEDLSIDMDLTAAEARKLAYQLIAAAENAEFLQAQAEEYFENHKE